jgi:hypothetical protein
VEASVRFGGGGDRIGIILDNGDTCRAVVMMVPGPTQLNLTSPLPYSAAVGKPSPTIRRHQLPRWTDKNGNIRRHRL